MHKIHQLACSWSSKEYLIINKFLMVSQTMFARMSTILGLISQHNNPGETGTKPWGGVNIIICGDFHQFKPVVQKKAAPLYWPINFLIDNEEDATGSKLYSHLLQQMCIQDQVWTEFLCYCRQARHLTMLWELLVTSPGAQDTLLQEAWRQAVLVTSQLAVQVQWNKPALRKHCQESGAKLYHRHRYGEAIDNKRKVGISKVHDEG